MAFRNVPFYRSVTLTPVVSNRGQAGIDGAMTDWDSYRGGLEYLIFSFLRRSHLAAGPDFKSTVRDLADHFIATRLKVALRLWLARRDYCRAYEIVVRLQYLDPAGIEDLEIPENLPLLVNAQTLAVLANGIAEIDRVVVAGVEDGQALGALFRDAVSSGASSCAAAGTAHREASAQLAGLLADESLRQTFLDQGYSPGLIVTEREVRGSVLL